MRKTTKILSLALALLLVLFAFAACKGVGRKGVWKNATYTSDKTLGEGNTTITLIVSAEEKSVTFTVKTDKDTIGEALTEVKLIEGQDSSFGMMVTKVNGIAADWDVDQTYWAFYINGEYAMTGVDSTPVTDGTNYSFILTKG